MITINVNDIDETITICNYCLEIKTSYQCCSENHFITAYIINDIDGNSTILLDDEINIIKENHVQ